jgi:hypothetical protein
MEDLEIIHDGAEALEMETTAVAVRPNGGAVQRAGDVVNPMELIRFAIDSKTPAAELSQLVALAEHVEERNARREFNRALAAFQRECPPVKKNKTANITTKGGGKFSYAYAERDVMAAHVKPFLEKHGFSLTFDTTMDEKGVLLTNICTLLHENGHSRTSKFTLPVANDSAASPQQKIGAADSYAARRTMAAVLGLDITDKEAPDEDVDAGPPINDDQLRALSALIDEKKRVRKNPDELVQRFLENYAIEELCDLPAKMFEPAMAMLRGIGANREPTR